MQNAQEMTEEFQREQLESLLEECTEDQRATFDKCYPHGVKKDDLIGALNLVIRTIKANKKADVEGVEQ